MNIRHPALSQSSFLACMLLALVLSWLPAPAAAALDDHLEAKVGQMLMIGFRGLDVEETCSVIQDIRAGRVGGVIIFDYDVALKSRVRNVASPEQLKNLVARLHAASPDVPLFVAIDQEGGRVNRLKEIFGFPATVSKGWLGMQNDLALTGEYSRQTARLLSELGININLSPVVDVNVNPTNPVIGMLERSFSDNPQIVAQQAIAEILSHQAEGILTALKHFPGHGSSTTDSHLGFTDITQTWTEIELEPYREILNSVGTDMIMTAHVFNSALDPTWPATLSPAIMQGLLRDQMNYQGVIISDDMQMQAITDHYSLEIALEQTILAGTDIIIFGNNLVYEDGIAQKAQEIILGLVRDGRITEARIQESYARIMRLKARLAARNNMACIRCDAF
ncbi:glycoside hydrolase family 3 protein [Desulfonatronum parangueonense]